MIPASANPFQLTEGTLDLQRKTCLLRGSSSLLSPFLDRLTHIPKLLETVFVTDRDEDYDVMLSLLEDKSLSSDEAYRLTITEQTISVSARQEVGWIWGLVSLYQMLREGHGSLACGEVTDFPRAGHRGFQLDCSRHFFEVETVKLMVELASLSKLNRFHWHLSDDQGYRLESRLYPELNAISSWRTELGGQTYGGFYRFDDIQEIVEFAKARGVEIIPEIDMPGHLTALLAAHLEWSCKQEAIAVPAQPGVYETVLCAGNAEAVEAIKALLGEIAELFPFSQIHIGGDEVSKTAWKACPSCQAKIQAEGLRDEEDLQASFTTELADYLISLGKTPICWNEALRGQNLHPDVVIQYWEDSGETGGYCKPHLETGRRWIYSYSPFCYFDYDAAMLPIRKVLACQPVLADGSPIPAENLLGFECELWSEGLDTPEKLLTHAFPRLFALAEMAWSGNPVIDEFEARCRQQLDWLAQDDILKTTWEAADPNGQAQIDQIVATWKPRIQQMRLVQMEHYLPSLLAVIQNMTADMLSQAEITKLMDDLLAP